ncbi:MAG: LysR family transcriptional regulator [Treponema sp.]|jgi:lysyl-tRNA synthetase class 2|nr:LysR family transcriptional regulator [Treponema sp.]
MDIELFEERARIIRGTRAFFDRRGYLELDTPLLAPDLIPEACLEVFETAYLPPGIAAGGRPYWLIPSPEIWMKRFIARHRRSIYQVCKCFRNVESLGRQHSPEFTMLEYYTMNAGYLDSLALTEEFFGELLGDTGQVELRPPFLRITMEEAFERWAGFNLYEAAEAGRLGEEARRLGLDPAPGRTRGEGLQGEGDTGALYDLIFIHAVEPKLPRDRPVALIDYPAFVPCLARGSPKGRLGGSCRTRERWELYVRGIELANCYSEETGPEEVRRYFDAETARKEGSALVPHRVDRDYWKLFLPDAAGGPFPSCSGVALGLDRLVMVLTGRSSIDGVLPFPMN